VFCVFPLCYCLVVNTSAINCLEGLISEMIYYVSSRTLNLTHSIIVMRSTYIHVLGNWILDVVSIVISFNNDKL